MECVLCSNLLPKNGFKEMDDHSGCTERCGKGLNLGHFECDDSNQIDGDGCSSICRIEDGYKCANKYTANNPDLCYRVTLPRDNIINIDKNNQVFIGFTRNVRMKIGNSN